MVDQREKIKMHAFLRSDLYVKIRKEEMKTEEVERNLLCSTNRYIVIITFKECQSIKN